MNKISLDESNHRLNEETRLQLLEQAYQKFNTPQFIPDDPICIPRRFTQKQDIEISGFIAAIFAWGQRKTIINKSNEFISIMGDAPFDFVKNHKEVDLIPFEDFKHRTFNGTDALYFISTFKRFYNNYDSLEDIFLQGIRAESTTIEGGLLAFHDDFFNDEFAPQRTRKHIPTPLRKSTCKRINMFLRWMVRRDNSEVDFGIWQRINPSQLICPCDVHVDRVARQLGLITRKQTDWQTALELTENLRQLDPKDPVKYDFALFGLGLEQKLKA